jgi:hypothetical protein
LFRRRPEKFQAGVLFCGKTYFRADDRGFFDAIIIFCPTERERSAPAPLAAAGMLEPKPRNRI